MRKQQDPAVIRVNHIPVCVSENIANRLRVGITPLFGSLRSYILCAVWRHPGQDKH